ncbi:F0F1 ATP synthase subunit delta [Stutzerimonas balearica]|uniref:F0F1 ATP synthase subunit delta n=1 Tax=Stutzerimonas balearica TaxID=74829 RepID=UPI0028ADF3BA|nr:F0F1 ATP synthase subunit delta [Stutzerimonas balearica]
MSLDWWTLGLQTINVVVLVWLLSHFLFKPVARIIAERQQAAERLLAEADQARQAADETRTRIEDEHQALQAQRDAALAQVEQDVQQAREQLLQAARAEADEHRRLAEAQWQTQQAQMRQTLEAQAAQLALEIAARLLQRLPESARVIGFIDGLAEATARLPEAVRQGLAEQSDALVLHAPRALDEAELAACLDALSGVLARQPTLEVRVDPSLIAGLELQGRTAQVHNSLRADLARVQQELQHGAG